MTKEEFQDLIAKDVFVCTINKKIVSLSADAEVANSITLKLLRDSESPVLLTLIGNLMVNRHECMARR